MEPVGSLEAMATKNNPTNEEADKEIVLGTERVKVFLIYLKSTFLMNLGPLPDR